ncbi:hypothetical protein LEP1GSC133_0391 [Leptospira borgpetersenii serovar Pomona str. 200901868]|uniref:Uncharacterized protein n=1 Tax=Leptospira borgpetersenii serovar Pomona str. 200901868 TaxID=1192866 RepID=M6W1F9_LEPBO|nr:hypothetical protein LEP1GSC133_0391 [Leptospira borgpetersenii serovar Pomona str. 200901868]
MTVLRKVVFDFIKIVLFVFWSEFSDLRNSVVRFSILQRHISILTYLNTNIFCKRNLYKVNFL